MLAEEVAEIVPETVKSFEVVLAVFELEHPSARIERTPRPPRAKREFWRDLLVAE